MEAPSRSTESPSSNSIQDCSILQFLIQASRLHYLFKEYVYTLIDVMGMLYFPGTVFSFFGNRTFSEWTSTATSCYSSTRSRQEQSINLVQ